MCALRARRECAGAFALVRVNIDPAILQTAAPQRADVVLAERSQPLAYPIDGLSKRYGRLIFDKRRPGIVSAQIAVAENAPPDCPIAMPRREIALEHVDQ